jgi:hypothetical protein
MSPLFKKLNYKEGQSILVLNHPDEFQDFMNEMKGAIFFHNPDEIDQLEFGIFFVKTQDEINSSIETIGSKLPEDPTLWFCYPKKSSKKYTCDFNRDTGWEKLGEYELEPVRQVAIDEDWSALRFRKVDKIKNFSRNKKWQSLRKEKTEAKNESYLI